MTAESCKLVINGHFHELLNIFGIGDFENSHILQLCTVEPGFIAAQFDSSHFVQLVGGYFHGELFADGVQIDFLGGGHVQAACFGPVPHVGRVVYLHKINLSIRLQLLVLV